MNFLTELKKRWALEAPTFHKKLIKFGNWLSATGLSLIGLPAIYQNLVPTANIDLGLLLIIAGYMVLAGSIISTVAGTAVKNPENIDKKI